VARGKGEEKGWEGAEILKPPDPLSKKKEGRIPHPLIQEERERGEKAGLEKRS